MKANMGNVDRLIRIIAAIGIVILFTTKQIHGNTAVVLLIFAAAFVLSSIAKVCPLYLPLKISTRKLIKK